MRTTSWGSTRFGPLKALTHEPLPAAELPATAYCIDFTWQAGASDPTPGYGRRLNLAKSRVFEAHRHYHAQTISFYSSYLRNPQYRIRALILARFLDWTRTQVGERRYVL